MPNTEGGDRVVKPNIGPHQKTAKNHLSFCEAYQMVSDNPCEEYETTGNHSVFVAKATRSVRGDHRDEQVIRFYSNDTERARAYKCCWGHITNCNGTYIGCYTEAISNPANRTR